MSPKIAELSRMVAETLYKINFDAKQLRDMRFGLMPLGDPIEE